MASSVETPSGKKSKLDRNLSGAKKIYSDTYKLTPSKFSRWDGVDIEVQKRDPMKYVPMEHAHIFHTFESNGRKTETSSLMGGHLHMVEVERGSDGVPVTVEQDGKKVLKLKVGGPMKIVSKLVGGKRRTTFEKIQLYLDKKGELVYDEHTHETQYIRSSVINNSEISQEASRVISELNAIYNPPLPAGVAEKSAE